MNEQVFMDFAKETWAPSVSHLEGGMGITVIVCHHHPGAGSNPEVRAPFTTAWRLQ